MGELNKYLNELRQMQALSKLCAQMKQGMEQRDKASEAME